MRGRRVYESTNNVGVNLKLKLEAKPNFAITPVSLLPPNARRLARNEDDSLKTRSELGTCVGMSAVWCRNLFQAANEAATKPGDMQSHFVQARWEHIRENANTTADRLRRFKEFLEANNLSGGNIAVPARTDFTAPQINNEITLVVADGTFLLFCPGHCVGIHRVEFNAYQGLRTRSYLFDPDKGLYAYNDSGDLDQDLATEYTQNRRYTANANVAWYYLAMG